MFANKISAPATMSEFSICTVMCKQKATLKCLQDVLPHLLIFEIPPVLIRTLRLLNFPHSNLDSYY